MQIDEEMIVDQCVICVLDGWMDGGYERASFRFQVCMVLGGVPGDM